MEMPITKPSMVSYADELDFPQLMDDLTKEGKNGFIRVTSGSEEGYILLKEGIKVAASYDNYSKVEALEKIANSLETPNTVIEVFDVGPSQVDYLLDLNKPYKIEEGSDVYDVIGELKKKSTETPEETLPEVEEPEEVKPVVEEPPNIEPEVNEPEEVKPVVEEPPNVEPEVKEDVEGGSVVESEVEKTAETKPVVKEPEEVKSETGTSEVEPAVEKVDDLPSETDAVEEPVEDNILTAEKPASSRTESLKQSESLEASFEAGNSSSEGEVIETPVVDEKPVSSPEGSQSPEASTEEDNKDEAPPDRSELLKKYGIKEVEEEQVEGLLQTYKGGIIDDDDVEKVELVLMNHIKKSVLGIPKIKGTEVMVFLDNYKELSGTINIITEFETQGFLNRIMGQSRTANNLRRQIINIAEIAIRKSFRQYPEVVEKFEINVEFS